MHACLDACMHVRMYGALYVYVCMTPCLDVLSVCMYG